MKKAIFTLAVLVMAFVNMGFAQGNTDLKSKITERVFKQFGLVRESYVVPQQARYNVLDATQYRTTYYYDESDYTLTEEIEESYSDGSWTNVNRIAYEYGFYGNVMAMLSQMWMSGDWMDVMRATFDYDGDEVSEVIYQINMGGSWVNQTKEVFNYNGDEWTMLVWTWNGSNWSSDHLYTYTRGVDEIEVLVQYMEGGAWQNEQRYIYSLGFDDNVTEIRVQEWAGYWVNYEKTTYVYENGVYTDQYVQEWEGRTWLDKYHYVFDYDEMGNAKHGACYAFDGYDWSSENGSIDMAFDFNADKKSFYGSEVEMIYVDLTSVNENAQTFNVKVYPMPAENEIFIQAENFQKAEIYSLTGQKLMESQMEKMIVGTLPSGVYLLKVYDRWGNAKPQKLMVK